VLFFEPDSMPAADVYQLMSALVVPRPIAWVSTRSPSGVDHLAPFSWYQIVSEDPATVQVTFTGRKDSLVHIEATGEFVVNTVDRAQPEAMNETAVDAPADLEEPVLAGVTMTASDLVGPRRVASAPAAMECRLDRTLVVGSSTVVFGRVVAVHVARHLWRAPQGRPGRPRRGRPGRRDHVPPGCRAARPAPTQVGDPGLTASAGRPDRPGMLHHGPRHR